MQPFLRGEVLREMRTCMGMSDLRMPACCLSSLQQLCSYLLRSLPPFSINSFSLASPLRPLFPHIIVTLTYPLFNLHQHLRCVNGRAWIKRLPTPLPLSRILRHLSFFKMSAQTDHHFCLQKRILMLEGQLPVCQRKYQACNASNAQGLDGSLASPCASDHFSAPPSGM